MESKRLFEQQFADFGQNPAWGLEMGLKNIFFKIKRGLVIIPNPLNLFWYARLESNQRLSAPEADALSSELRAQTGT